MDAIGQSSQRIPFCSYYVVVVIIIAVIIIIIITKYDLFISILHHVHWFTTFMGGPLTSSCCVGWIHYKHGIESITVWLVNT